MAESGRLMSGLTFNSLRRHPSLVPLLISIGGGSVMAALYTLRLATKNPDVSWNKRTNPYPWEKYMNKQYKFYSARVDYNKVKPPPERPNL